MLKDKTTGKLKYQGYNGEAEALNSKAVVLYNTHNTSTTTHEILHAMGLRHSFDNKGNFTFKKFATDNIMDYSDIGPNKIPVISIWQWQWVKANKSIK